MKATIFRNVGEIAIEEIPTPVAGPTDVVVKTKRAAICGSDLTAYAHDNKVVGIGQGSEFGHEFVGEVVEVGSEVNGIIPGMRVFVNPTRAKKGFDLKCNTCGAFSEYVLIENAALGFNLYELAENLSYDDAVLTEPFCVSTHGADSVNPQKGEKAVIFGAGPIGLCALAALKSFGVEDVVVSDMIPLRLQKVKDMGGTPHNFTEAKLSGFIKEHFGTVSSTFGKYADCDIFIDCAGVEKVISDFYTFAKVGARLSIVAVHKKPIVLDQMNFFTKQLHIVGSCAYGDTQIKRVLGILEKDKSVPKNLITHRFKFADINQAFEAAKNQQEAIKVVIDYE
ncbi:zinc-binding dehydrogenase [Dehalobacter sp. DCM]|uniref:zinc-dependent alcohol dehydrogenase n=1 Tax=Dehalobacter sp. DCM TaxID=2907827 RepID=UPI003081D559|nr:zinc-binding dehydrogenase [Dehalobacter sp. DCM]